MRYKDSHVSDTEMLRAADGELSKRRQRQVNAHLLTCWHCRSRMAAMQGTIANFAASYRAVFDSQLPPESGSAARLGARLREEHERNFSLALLLRWKWAALLCLVLAIGLMIGIFSWRKPTGLESEAVPNPYLTPGETTPRSKSEVCQANEQAGRRPIPEALKHAVFAEYGMKDEPPDAYEVDFLITPELGGSASIRNLWPQPYSSRAWNAHVKDALEERLHQLVCRGDLDLSTAQREIATNWVSAYKKYVQGGNPM